MNRVQPLGLIVLLWIAFGAFSLTVDVAAGNKGTGLLKASSWRWTVPGAVVLGVAAYQHFTCPRGGAGAAPLCEVAAPPRPPTVVHGTAS